jgi:homopolymeric O-antigen transport system permease protein
MGPRAIYEGEDMKGFGALFRYRKLIWDLVVLDIKLRYVGSWLGLAWMLVAPLIVLGAYLLLFGKILQVNADPGVSPLTYGLLMACGLLPWVGFAEGVTRGTSSVLAQRNLLQSGVFPIELVPVSGVCTALLGQAGMTGLLLVVLGLRGNLGLTIALLPLLFVLQALFTIGVVWFLSCVNILYRDTSQVVGLMMVLLMFVSPIAYTQQMVPAGLEVVVALNPLSYLIEGYRETLLFNHVPSVRGLAVFGGLACVAFVTGYQYFMRLRRVLPDFV